MLVKIDPSSRSYDQVSSLQPLQGKPPSSIDSIHQMADSTTPQMSCWDSLIAYLQSIFSMIIDLLTCKSKLDKLLEDPRAFLEKLISLDPKSVNNEFARKILDMENTLAIRNLNDDTVLYYLSKFEGDPSVAQSLGFEVTPEVIQQVASKRSNDFSKYDDSGLFLIVKSAATAEFFLKIPEFLANIEEPDSDCRTALHLAVMEERADIAKCLITYGANIDATDENYLLEQTPVHKIRSVKMAEIFAGVEDIDFDVLDKKQNNLLGLLIQEGIEKHRELIRYLIVNHGADISEEDCDQLKAHSDFKALIEDYELEDD